MAPKSPFGPRRAALEVTLKAVTLTPASAALVEATRGLADAVDVDPSNASLWREYRAALATLTASEEGADVDEHRRFLSAVATPKMGHPTVA